MNWIKGRTIGRGSTASVSLATCLFSGDTFAVKSADSRLSDPLRNEARVLSSLDSPYIVGYRGCEVARETDGTVFNLFLEYAPAGSLADAIGKRGGLEEAEVALYARQILMGLDYLHSRGIVHCDVKPSNVLIDCGGCAKIADFGCSKRVGAAPGSIGGTPMYMAPEAACGMEQGCPADIWAFGCAVAEMATGKFPWAGMCDPASVVHKIVYSGESPEIPTDLSANGKDFLEKCLRRNPKERWTAGRLLDHPFLEQVNSGISSKEPEEFSHSPTSVMDQEFWEFDEAACQATARLTCSGVSTRDRIDALCSSGEELYPSWSNDDEWIDVRGGKEECGSSGKGAGPGEWHEPADILEGVGGSEKSLESVGNCQKPSGSVVSCRRLLCLDRTKGDSIQKIKFL